MSVIEAPQREDGPPQPPPPETKEPTKRDVLHRAADLLEEFGWCQGIGGMPGSSRHEGRFCYLGAVARASYDFGAEPSLDPYRDAAEVLGLIYDWGRRGCAVAKTFDWNDDTARTRQEVVARLRAEAEAA